METDEVYARDRSAWRRWLSEHATRPRGVWVIYDKGPTRALTYDAIVEEALCFGWVDSKSRRLSESQTMLYLAPRRRGSAWSRSNKQRVERLIAAGLMHPRGLEVIEAARADGSWTALDDVENLIEPADLAAALDARPLARQTWDAFPPSARRAILQWIGNAKTTPTRATRIQRAADEAAAGRRVSQGQTSKAE